MKYAGQKKVAKQIDEALKKAESVSDDTKLKNSALAKLYYYNKLRKKNN